MKRITALFLCITLLSVSLSSCTKNLDTQITPNPKTYPDFKVLTIDETGCIRIPSPDALRSSPQFTDLAGPPSYHLFLKDLQNELGFQLDFSEIEWNDSSKSLLGEKIDSNGYNLVLCTENIFAYALEEIAADYPSTRFFIYDSTGTLTKPPPNVTLITAAQNEAEFLCGMVAAGMSESGVLGMILGTESPAERDAMVGYIEGARFANPSVKIAVTTVGSHSDAPKGKEITQLLIDNSGADIIHSTAGSSGMGVIEVSSNSARVLWYIGADTDLYTLLKDSQPGMARRILTSGMAQWENIIEKGIRDLIMPGSHPTYYGEVARWGLREEAVGIAKNEMYLKYVPEDVRKKVEDATQKIIGGSIQVSTAYGMSEEQVELIKSRVKP